MYNTAARSFEAFCSHYSIAPYRAFGRYNGVIRRQTKIQPATISAYLFALRSVHVDLKLPTTDFDDDHMKPFMAGVYTAFPHPPRAPGHALRWPKTCCCAFLALAP
ncbi:hypothetical protein E4U22_005632 [Claviceps purpurea]|nr:hypothetical protein E4U22_005632 [Claviceps purpurea]